MKLLYIRHPANALKVYSKEEWRSREAKNLFDLWEE
jgi:hypothetical protein